MPQPKISLQNLLTIPDAELSDDACLMRHYFMQIIQDLPNNVYWRDEDSKGLGANNTMLKFCKMTKLEDFIGGTYEDMTKIAGWSKAQGLSLKNDDRAVMKTGVAKINEEEPVFYDDEGLPIYYISTRIPLRNEQGSIQGIVGISADITEIKRREEELLIYEQVIKNIPCNVYWKNTEGIYLGGNIMQAELLGDNFIGKKVHAFFDNETADMIEAHDLHVMQTKERCEFEEGLHFNGVKRIFLSHKSPLKDSKQNIIGMVGTSFDITERKKQEERLTIYGQIIDLLPGNIYWKDRNGVYLGRNRYSSETMHRLGVEPTVDPEAVIGKTDYDFFDKEIADAYHQHDQEIIASEQVISYEEKMSLPNGEHLINLSIKRPLKDANSNIIGVIGNSLDITDRKRLEEKQNEFAKVVLQVVHDIRSPLVVIDMLSKEADHFHEEQRILLRNAVQRINDIASHLISSYKGRTGESASTQKIPLAVFINRIISEKRFQFAKEGIEFAINVAEQAYFCFILFESSELQRILSNLINNAVEAATDNKLIEINLDQYRGQLLLSIQDHGVGMSAQLLKKVGEYGVSHGKEKSAGLGLAHAKEWMRKYNAQLHITSEVGRGTNVTLELPQCTAPSWFAQELILRPNSILLIIDDDPTIHFLWKQRLKGYQRKLPKLKVYHFNYSKDLLKWFSSHKDKVSMNDVILLSDNELIGSELNGQQLLTKFSKQIGQAFLVTSHYAFYELADHLTRTNARLVPKELVSHLPIKVEEVNKLKNQLPEKIEFVFLDDNATLIGAYEYLIKVKKRHILLFSRTQDLLAALPQIPKDTLIYIDSQLEGERGEIFAKTLYEQGYHELYLASAAMDTSFNIKDYPWLKGVRSKPKL